MDSEKYFKLEKELEKKTFYELEIVFIDESSELYEFESLLQLQHFARYQMITNENIYAYYVYRLYKSDELEDLNNKPLGIVKEIADIMNSNEVLNKHIDEVCDLLFVEKESNND
ncbi:MAG: hypothetical protein J6S85_23050 [Methanobrevibacter sp.]|nr:hypothetical protein [Methanobrevibacter sp.]